ncbi:MAG: carboxypeptidase M32 [Verrucomicrobia bacterium]|nr:MAG: carboxypeptidase M32 [Verrucomicrobiota bacterium]
MHIFDLAREHAVIGSSEAVLGWDQETYLPPAAAAHRARQLSWLTAKAHELATSAAWQRALEEAEAGAADADFTLRANLREMRRMFDRATKLPVALVAREAAACSLAKHAWAEARERADFAGFAPHLTGLLEIAREKAERWGYPDEPYDALLDGYERRTSTAAVAALFDSLRPELRRIAASAVEISAAQAPGLPPGPYPISGQQRLNAQIAEAIGFDFQAGRIDTTHHPFCTTLGPRDVRLTTRYDEGDFTSSLFGVLHEAGHGLYDQGLPADDFGLPSGSPLSLGIHESQSRLWENHIGRSRAFWNRWYPVAQDCFPQLARFPLENFLRYLWRAEFSPIRVDADEATYDLHILLRFGIERQMVNGSLAVADIPAAWNEGFRELFGFTPVDAREGCLQDIHWAMGGLGYFATYSLGNINAAQLHAAACSDPQIAAACEQADYAPLLAWLRKSIHGHGATLDSAELITQASGKAPSPSAYLAHLQARYL